MPRNCSKKVRHREGGGRTECTRWPEAPVLAFASCNFAPSRFRSPRAASRARAASRSGRRPSPGGSRGSTRSTRTRTRASCCAAWSTVNRLHNDVERRRRTIACFVPPLRALHERLADTARAQPLPLTADFERDRALAADLLREESIAFRTLLVDADAPLEADAPALDAGARAARRARRERLPADRARCHARRRARAVRLGRPHRARRRAPRPATAPSRASATTTG